MPTGDWSELDNVLQEAMRMRKEKKEIKFLTKEIQDHTDAIDGDPDERHKKQMREYVTKLETKLKELRRIK